VNLGIVFLFLSIGVQVYVLKEGDSIDKILSLAEIEREIEKRVINRLREKVNLKKCRTGEVIYIRRRGNKFIEFRYEKGRNTWIIDSLFRIKNLPVREELIYLSGILSSGILWYDLLKVKGTPQLVFQFANEVFAWDIDFNTETYKKDEFEIIAIGNYIEERFIGYQRILFALYKSKYRGKRVGIHFSSYSSSYYNLEGKSLRRAFLRAPLSYIRISSGFTLRRFHPILRRWMPHQGVDYAAPYGTPVRAIGRGRVIFVGWKRGLGKQVIIKHPNGFKSYYGHLSRFAKGIYKGKYVEQGEIIGKVGSTGLSTGPHLDFRLKKGGRWINPLKLSPPHEKPLKGKELERYKKYRNKLLIYIKGLRVWKKLAQLEVKREKRRKDET
jgi:murein DD-endopeptidase MepM/ murein hydrolase activator NlpD